MVCDRLHVAETRSTGRSGRTINIYEDHAVLELEVLDGPRSTVAGDNDNSAKAVQDALNTKTDKNGFATPGAFKDDRQITELHAVRHPKASKLRVKKTRAENGCEWIGDAGTIGVGFTHFLLFIFDCF